MKLLVQIAGFCLAVLMAVQTQGNEPVVIAVADYHPYNDKEGNGLASDLYRAAFNEVGLPVTIITTPIRRGVTMLLNQQVDALSSGNLFLHGEQLKAISWIPTFRVIMASFFLEPGPHSPGSLTSIGDLHPYRVGAVVNSSVLEYFAKHGLEPILLQTPDQLLGLTQRGRLDYFTITLLSGLLLIDATYSGQQQRFGFHPWYSIDSGLSFLNGSPNSMELKALYEQGLNKIKANGLYLQIHESYWGPGNVPSDVLPDNLKSQGVSQVNLDLFLHVGRNSSGKMLPTP